MERSDSSVGIVLVNYNGRQFLNDCVRALLSGTFKNFEVIVVDNQSTDDSVNALRREFPSVSLLQQSRNLGVAGGNNVGIGYCRERHHSHVLFLNYDTLPDPELLDELLRVSQPDVLVSGSTYFWDDPRRSNSHAGAFRWALGRLDEQFYGRVHDEFAGAVHEVAIADTCCLLVPTSVFDRIGPMDENYFLYYDDTDFVVRARAAGFRCVLNPDAKLKHYERGSSGPADASPVSAYYSTRNRPYFMRKHAPSRLHYAAFLGYFLLTRTVTMAKWAVMARWSLVQWSARGFRDFLLGRMGAAAVRPARRS